MLFAPPFFEMVFPACAKRYRQISEKAQVIIIRSKYEVSVGFGV